MPAVALSPALEESSPEPWFEKVPPTLSDAIPVFGGAEVLFVLEEGRFVWSYGRERRDE